MLWVLIHSFYIQIFHGRLTSFTPGDMINPQWLKQPIFRTNFHASKDIQAIEVQCNTCTAGVILEGDLGEKGSLSWPTSPYFELREK